MTRSDLNDCNFNWFLQIKLLYYIFMYGQVNLWYFSIQSPGFTRISLSNSDRLRLARTTMLSALTVIDLIMEDKMQRRPTTWSRGGNCLLKHQLFNWQNYQHQNRRVIFIRCEYICKCWNVKYSLGRTNLKFLGF